MASLLIPHCLPPSVSLDPSSKGRLIFLAAVTLSFCSLAQGCHVKFPWLYTATAGAPFTLVVTAKDLISGR